jgi:hypothetical protein
VTPQAMAVHSVRERQRIQLTTVVSYEEQSFTVTNAVGGTFRLRFEDNPAVGVLYGCC